MILTINGQQVALKKGASIEYVSENRIFTEIIRDCVIFTYNKIVFFFFNEIIVN